MYKYLFLLVFLPVITQALTIPEIIATTALKYGIDPKLALYISYKESGWDPSAKGDYHNGSPTSFGIFQIHNPKQKGITKEQALDPMFAAEWSMKTMIKDGDCHQWSTCPASSSD